MTTGTKGITNKKSKVEIHTVATHPDYNFGYCVADDNVVADHGWKLG